MIKRWLQWAAWAMVMACLASSMATEDANTAAKVFAISLLLIFFVFITLGIFRETPARSPAPTRRSLRSRCYLVVHLDLKVSPPAVVFVHTYSCGAKDLTHTGAREARADLYMIEADTFQDALDEMQRIQPLYFPWATPYLTRNR